MFYSKYCASGNDFIITHSFLKYDRSDIAKKLCHRNYGIGADGFIVLLPHHSCDMEWEFYNSDGSKADMCGNGTRASAMYGYDNGLCKDSLSLQTGAGKIELSINGNIVKSELSPYTIESQTIEAYNRIWWKINTGVPHLVSFEDDIYALSKEELKALRHAHNANVNVGKLENNILRIRTFERGVEDETLACGTGMAALFLRAYKEGSVQKSSKIIPSSGEELTVECDNDRLFFEGKVQRVGSFVLELN